MDFINCPYCQHANPVARVTCENCFLRLQPLHGGSLAEREPAPRRTLRDEIADFISYSAYALPDVNLDLEGFFGGLRTLKPDLGPVARPQGLAGSETPAFQLPDLAIKAPDLPHIDLSILTTYLANLQVPAPDFGHVVETIGALRLPQVDLPALAELLPHLDFSLLDPQRLAELLPQIDLSIIDPAILGDLLAHLDLTALDLSALADVVGAIDWSLFADLADAIDWAAFGELLLEVDLSILLELLEGIDL